MSSKQKSFGDDLYGDYDASGYKSTNKGFGKSKAATYVRCYESHPPLKLGGSIVYGGSCSTPITNDADVYIGFDWGMKLVEVMPWERDIQQVFFEIHDMQAPSSSKKFIKLIDWSAEQLAAGKVLHAGCIGGHGRTGTFLAALVQVITGEADAISWVRKNYCKKAVESHSQVDFLHKHFGIMKVSGAKDSGGGHGRHVDGWNIGNTVGGHLVGDTSHYPKATGGKEIKGGWNTKPPGAQFKDSDEVTNFVKSSACVFNEGAVF